MDKDTITHHTDLVKVLTGLMVLAAFSIGSVVLFYVLAHGTTPLKSKEAWGQFGDYFGGTLNPILAFLSLIAIILTLSIQSKQLMLSKQELANSREELQATRDELRRTADSQAAAAEALNKQVRYTVISTRVAAISVTLKVIEDELENYKKTARFASNPDVFLQLKLQDRRKALQAQLEELSQDLAKEA